jgi:hypothetical protein
MLKRVFLFYYEGFREMTVGRILWMIILIKLAIMFLILKPFFFPNYLKDNFANEKESIEYVKQELTTPIKY